MHRFVSPQLAGVPQSFDLSSEMLAQNNQGLAQVWQLLWETMQQDLASTLLRHGVRCIDDIQKQTAQLAAHGVAPWRLELLSVSGPAHDMAPKTRWDVPTLSFPAGSS